MRDYKKIRAWALADDLTVAVYQATKSFPATEIYALTSQVRRAAYSVPANIAEGASRKTKKDYLHFLYIARGSLSEAEYFLHLSERLLYLSATDCGVFNDRVIETQKCLFGLIKAVEEELICEEND
ncbi:MAG: four helix bundle protein [Kiritimatiellae bacterium]|nr:four helix bundle protein [Kiritimatiellia bacterium]